MGTKLLLPFYVFLSLYGFSKADCPGQQQLIYNSVKQQIFFYNPGGVNSPVVANCSSFLGYNITGVGLKGTLAYCTSLDAGDTVVITDGTTTTTINSTVCAANNNGGNQIELFNGTYSNFLNVTVTEVSNKAALFAIAFQQGEALTSQSSTTPPATVAPYNDTNPKSARMELAFVVDTSFGLGKSFFENTTKPIIQNLASSFLVGTDINTQLTRLALVRLATQTSLGGSLAPAWQIDQPTFTSLLSSLFVTTSNSTNSIFSNTLSEFIKDAFDKASETPARSRTQKVLIIFVNNDTTTADTNSSLVGLANDLMDYDVHSIIVNMGSNPLTNLLGPLNSKLQGSNKLGYKQYNDTDGVNGTVNNLLTQVLLNGDYLCSTRDAVTLGTNSATITIPVSNGQANTKQPQAYCSSINFQYNYLQTPSTNNVTVTVNQEETTVGIDSLEVFNGGKLVASFSGLEIQNAEICFSNNPNITVALNTTYNSILGGVKVTIKDAPTPCPEVTWPPTFYRRKK